MRRTCSCRTMTIRKQALITGQFRDDDVRQPEIIVQAPSGRG
jgi:hypothetical protein